MRHTYATLRLSKGDSLAEVSKKMGHGNTDLTYKTYYKWLPRESRTNIDELDKRTQPDATQAQPNKNELTKIVNPLKSLEAAPGFEPGNKGFAEEILKIKSNEFSCLSYQDCQNFTTKSNLSATDFRNLQGESKSR